MKTVNQLLEKYTEEYSGLDAILHFQYRDLLQFVPYKKAYPHLEEKVTPIEWGDHYLKLDRRNVKKVMKEYMSFAWEKVCSRRGISAVRNLAHFKVWLWILEEHKLLTFLDDARNYACYGAPVLARICIRFRWDYRKFVNPWHKETAAGYVDGKGC